MPLSKEMEQILKETQEQLRRAYERETVIFMSKITTLEVTINQQNIKIKKLEEQIKNADKTKPPESFPYTHPIRPISTYNWAEGKKVENDANI